MFSNWRYRLARWLFPPAFAPTATRPRHQVWVLGDLPPKERTIADMEPGESGYAVPWAWNEDAGQLRESFPVGHKGGTASMRVECIQPGEYRVEFEEPIYRNPFTGEYSSGNKGRLR